jgi:hypothetical protein
MPDDLDGAKRWREQKSGGSAETLRQRRIELVAEQKEKLAIANRVRRGELIEAAAAFESSARVCAAAKTRLLAFERDLPPQLEGASAAQIAKILHREIVRVLTDLSQGYRDEGLA